MNGIRDAGTKPVAIILCIDSWTVLIIDELPFVFATLPCLFM